MPEVRHENDGEDNPDGGPGHEPFDGQIAADVERELMKWKEKAETLTKEFGETFSDTVKVGIVVSRVPVRRERREGGGRALGKGPGERARERAYPPRANRRATAGVRRDLEREDSRDPASGAASRALRERRRGRV